MKELVHWLELLIQDSEEQGQAAHEEGSHELASYYEGKIDTAQEIIDGLDVISHPASVCAHYWIKLTPLDPYKQKYMCLNCDEVK